MQEEKIVETKKCKQCNTSFDITDKDLEFYDKVSPMFEIPHPNPLLIPGMGQAGEGIKGLGNNKYKFSIPTPTLCPDCRQQRRLAFRNERKLYKRKCDGSGDSIISMYSPDKDFLVYSNEYWWSDKWEAMDYAQVFDFNKTFFEQFKKLFKKVPRINLYNQRSENSPYSNYETDEKNCYVTIGGHWNENCMYGNYYIKSKDSIDNYWLFESANCYECIICYNLYNCFYLQYCNKCIDCFLGYDLINCKNCFGCVGLRNKEFYIFNKQYNHEEYYEKLKEFNFENHNNFDNLKKQFNSVYLKVPHKNLNMYGVENSVGDDIFNSKNIINSFSTEDVENCKNSIIVGMGKDAMDLTSVGLFELFYEFSSGGYNGYKNVSGLPHFNIV